MALSSFQSQELGVPSSSQLTLKNYQDFLSQPVYGTSTFWSFLYALVVTSISLITGYLIAYMLIKVRTSYRAALLIIISLPLILNLLTISFAWIVLLQRKGVINWLLISLGIVDEPIQMLFTTGSVLVGMIYVVLPIMIFTVFSSLQQIDDIYYDAARVMGATPWQAFRRIILPLSLPGIIAGLLIVFLASFGLYLVPELLGGPSYTLLPFLIQQQLLEYLNWPKAAALSVALILLMLPATISLPIFVRKLISSNLGGV